MRKIPYRTGAWILIVMGALMVFVAPPTMLFDGNRKAVLLSELGHHGRHVLADITMTSPPYSRNTRVTYSFEANGRKYHETEEVSGDVIDRARHRGQVDVVYSTTDPKRSTADAERLARSSKALLSWGPWFVALMGLLFAGIGVYRFRSRT